MGAVPRTIALLLLVLSGAGTAAAQGTGAVRGRVVDGEGQPLENVEVLVRGVERTTLTNAAGAFRLDGIPVGERLLIARRPGYTAAERTVMVIAAEAVVVEVVLRAVAQQLDSIAVDAARPRPLLIGHVHDTNGRPLEDVEIVLQGVRRTVRTNAAGTFRFDSLSADRYRMTARLLGYTPAQSLVTVTQTPPTEVALRLRAFTPVLETIEVVADRRGLYGVVSTPDLQPVANARVQVFGAGMTQQTDSAGRFAFPDIKPGSYLVGTEYPGLEARGLHVEMGRGKRLEVAVTMAVENPSVRPVPGAWWINHELGITLSFEPSWKRMSRSELARYQGRQLCDVARVVREARGTEATIIVDGLRVLKPWSLCAFNSDEVALITFTGGCKVMGLPILPAAGTRCIGIWTR